MAKLVWKFALEDTKHGFMQQNVALYPQVLSGALELPTGSVPLIMQAILEK